MMASTWRTEVLTALHERDEREKANIQLINEYTKLADRATYLQNAYLASTSTSSAPAPSSTLATSSNTLPSGSNTELSQSQDAAAAAQVRHLQQCLIEAQQARNAWAVQLKAATQQLQALSLESTSDTRKLEEQKQAIDVLEHKLNNRNDEKVVNIKIVENLQDEILALNIQLNLMDQAKQKLRAENDELIRRWKAIRGGD